MHTRSRRKALAAFISTLAFGLCISGTSFAEDEEETTSTSATPTTSTSESEASNPPEGASPPEPSPEPVLTPSPAPPAPAPDASVASTERRMVLISVGVMTVGFALGMTGTIKAGDSMDDAHYYYGSLVLKGDWGACNGPERDPGCDKWHDALEREKVYNILTWVGYGTMALGSVGLVIYSVRFAQKLNESGMCVGGGVSPGGGSLVLRGSF